MAVMTDVREAAQNLIEHAIHRSMIGQDDRIWAYNTILECIGATGPALDMAWALQVEKLSLVHPDTLPDFDLEGTLAALSETAVANGAAEDTASGRDRIAMRIMGVLMPRPSVVNEEFNGRMGVNEPRAATDWFYGLCCDAGYVRRAAIARNIKWNTPTNWGDLEITINLSKPEKDPRDIAAAGAAKNTGEKYPACQLCIENEGYPGRSAAADGGAHPARQNLRVIPIQLDGERWGFQYSPYAYFNEHCIAMSSEHRPMHVDRKGLTCLLDFVDLFPHYFIGSNADLPIVGGSILSHDHFQGGAHEFPMMHAAEVSQFSVPGFDQVTGTVLQWPLSVLRLRSHDRAQLLDAAEKIILAWREWTDESVGVIAHTADGVAHNTVTPVIRRVDSRGNAGGEIYEAYLALRCNITTDEHPLGVFHPHVEYHHIKKENIGLIEVMGLAILPPRRFPSLALSASTCWRPKPMPATTLLARSRATTFAAATPHGPRTSLPAAPTSLRPTTPSISCTKRSAWCLATCSTTPASLSGTKPAAPPSSALSTRCSSEPERTHSTNSAYATAAPAGNIAGGRRFLSVVIGDVLKRLVIKERPR